MVLTVTLNPSVDRLIYVDDLAVNDTNRITQIEEDAGGKGVNVARVLHRLDVETVATGFLGGRPGRYVEHVLKTEGVNCQFVHITSPTRTNIAIQERDGSPPTTLNERGGEVKPEDLRSLQQKIRELADGAQFVALGGSLPPGAAADTYASILADLRPLDVPVVLDADGEALVKGLQGHPYLIKPNEKEAERLLGCAVDTLDDGVAAARRLHEGGIPVVVVSMGAKGAAIAGDKGSFTVRPPMVRTVSTVGSGDSMIAGILSVLTRGGGLDEALRWGAAAGAATAMTDGSDIGTAEQTRALLPDVQVSGAR